ncbi:acyltransferase family protein [Frateuria terrea]|uniref:Peptidoglycan/LPS O-acetylase OafA/YrhL, contains acyltransferase and SGNH-hydrolase domains n=1 Tax=Frateuria terrea TaxID=529704 RepID=A0A1H6S7C7_9GAMM|nr:acyltransferase [Frateuria terrea]SEI63779.1 Peptidoglycan/LPS O-acetylase OafA/YrhL, contains acyltransferase and SGNH-hydrolase domains [Frateuria terrea]SFP24235.1 Peptidoglycan/LPS O-acetylase OafA/YrhL, contains acyltransferase and SGNH-hydrolase domains [Frateuria terrea]
MSTLPTFPANPELPAEKEVARQAAPALLVNLNTLRAVAALAVVYSHITSEAGLNLQPSIGTRGVDIFFVISGFIIAYISSRNADHFFARRLIRIVPFYWAATLVVFCVALVAPRVLRSTQPDVVQLLCSLLFIPRETTYAGMFPTLVLGWSLNYEMYFYILFGLSLLISRRLAPILCCVAITAVLWLIDASGSQNPSVQFYARPIVFEFVFGIVAFYLVRAADRHRDALLGAPMAKPVLLLVLGAALTAIFYIEAEQGFGLARQLSAGIPAFFIVFCAILLERIYRLTIDSRVLFLLGEASYILYLIHPYVVFGLLRTALRGVQGGPAGTVAVIVVLMVVSSAIAIAIHVYFERPVMRFLRQRFLGRSRSA